MRTVITAVLTLALMACEKTEMVAPYGDPSRHMYATFDNVSPDDVPVVIDRATQSNVVYRWQLAHDSTYALWANTQQANVYRNDVVSVIDRSATGYLLVQLSAYAMNIEEDGTYTFTTPFELGDTITFSGNSAFDGCITDVRISCPADTSTCYPRLDWSNCGNVGNTYYGDGFTNGMYLPADALPILPEVRIVIDAEQDQNGDAVETFRRKETRWTVHIGMVPWHVVDALSDLPLHDTITMNYRDGGSDTITDVVVQVERPEGFGECLADITLTYRIESEAVACCDTFDPPCDDPCTSAYDFDDAVPGEGRTYLSIDSPEFVLYSGGDFGEYQECTSGIATFRGVDSDYTVWWDMNAQEWRRLCDIVLFEVDSDDDGCFVTIEADMVDGYSGILQYSADSTTWEDTELDLSADEWAETGTGVYRPIEGQETGYFRIRIYVDECTAGYSEYDTFTCPS